MPFWTFKLSGSEERLVDSLIRLIFVMLKIIVWQYKMPDKYFIG